MSTEVYSVKGRVVGAVEDTKSENQALAHRDPLCFSRYGISWCWAEQASRRHPTGGAKEFIGAGSVWESAARAGFTAVRNFSHNSAVPEALKIQSFSQHIWWQTWPNLCLLGSNAFAWPKSQKVSLIKLNILTFRRRNTNVSNYGFAVP